MAASESVRTVNPASAAKAFGVLHASRMSARAPAAACLMCRPWSLVIICLPIYLRSTVGFSDGRLCHGMPVVGRQRQFGAGRRIDARAV